ncbi:type II toxin-antitoxin system RelE/ParE family toxin [Brucella sp. IR073]|uniref:type II toxin-antitoxin system RelE/ParE family toxin n=1 Tax=unclassified Brucella TaxID=2632610 RepID=UPI003B98374C
MTGYILAKAAETDLRDIMQSTRKQWGAPQMRRYIAALKQGITSLAAGRGASKDMSALYPSLRMARCEHHYVFCLSRKDAPALIIAIFHERMDLMTRLADRLNDQGSN